MVFGIQDLIKEHIYLSTQVDNTIKSKQYILASDGLYLKKENEFFDWCVRVEEFKNTELKLPRLENKLAVKERIPIELVLHIMAYYRHVDKRHKTEASALIFYNPHQKEIPVELKEEYKESIREYGNFVLLIPHHYASAGYTSFYSSTDESKRDKAHGWMVTNLIKVMQTHSHNSMDAFWSGVDDEFERQLFNCLFLVMGRVNTDAPTFRLRAVFNHEFYDLDGSGDHDLVNTIIEPLTVKTSFLGVERIEEVSLSDAFHLVDFDNLMEIPQDWMDCLNFYSSHNGRFSTSSEYGGFSSEDVLYGYDVDESFEDDNQEFEKYKNAKYFGVVDDGDEDDLLDGRESSLSSWMPKGKYRKKFSRKNRFY